MIYALHGAVGMAQDWQNPFKGIPNQMLQAVNLWRFLQCCPMPIEKFGAALNGENSGSGNTLLGYSMGGRLALHSLLDEDSKWQRAIIVSAHTGLAEADRPARRQLDTEWSAQALIGKWEDFLTKWNSQSILPASDLPDRRLLRPYRSEIARSFMDWSTGAQQDLLPRLKEIDIPVLWITGANDSKFTELAKTAVQELPNGQLEVVPNCGHRVPWEDPTTFARLVSEFCETPTSSSLEG